jgi:hypothetical protein
MDWETDNRAGLACGLAGTAESFPTPLVEPSPPRWAAVLKRRIATVASRPSRQVARSLGRSRWR